MKTLMHSFPFTHKHKNDEPIKTGVQHILSCIYFLAFRPQCSGDFNADRTLYTISCAASDGTQPIASATYSVNGVDMGSGIEKETSACVPHLNHHYLWQLHFHWISLFQRWWREIIRYLSTLWGLKAPGLLQHSLFGWVCLHYCKNISHGLFSPVQVLFPQQSSQQSSLLTQTAMGQWMLQVQNSL